MKFFITDVEKILRYRAIKRIIITVFCSLILTSFGIFIIYTAYEMYKNDTRENREKYFKQQQDECIFAGGTPKVELTKVYESMRPSDLRFHFEKKFVRCEAN